MVYVLMYRGSIENIVAIFVSVHGSGANENIIILPIFMCVSFGDTGP